MKKILILCLAVIFMQNTANAVCLGQKCTMKKVLKSWDGKKIDDVIAVWGYPDKQRTIAGHNLYVWSQGTYKVKNAYGTKTKDYCTRSIEVNDKNIVIGGESRGAACPATLIGARKWKHKEKTN